MVLVNTADDPTAVEVMPEVGGVANEGRIPAERKLTVRLITYGNATASAITIGHGSNRSALTIILQRTIRVPDNRDANALPPSCGEFPIYKVSDYAHNMPDDMARKGGVFIPMYQREAMWVQFHSTTQFAIKMYVGGVNAVSGFPMVENEKTKEKRLKMLNSGKQIQDYMVVPNQPWLDGIVSEDGKIRQFVAKPKGTGFSVEAQVTGEENVGGMQFEIIPVKKNLPEQLEIRYEDRQQKVVTRSITLASKGLTAESTWIDVKKVVRDEFDVSIKDQQLSAYPETTWGIPAFHCAVDFGENVKLGDVYFPKNFTLRVVQNIPLPYLSSGGRTYMMAASSVNYPTAHGAVGSKLVGMGLNLSNGYAAPLTAQPTGMAFAAQQGTSFPLSGSTLFAGNTTQPASGGALFGGAGYGQAAPTAGTGLFGSNIVQQQQFAFGNISSVGGPSGGTLFGSAAPAGRGGLFGSSTVQQQQSAFGNVSSVGGPSGGALFGSAAPVGGGGPFGPGPPPKSLFGNDSGVLKGPGFQPSLSASSTSVNPFGTFGSLPHASNPSLFGAKGDTAQQCLVTDSRAMPPPPENQVAADGGSTKRHQSAGPRRKGFARKAEQERDRAPTVVKEMGISAGGFIKQTINPDTHEPDVWDTDASVMMNVQILDSESFCAVTGLPPPSTPVDAATYAQHGYPFFEIWGEKKTGIKGEFGEVKSVAQIEAERAAAEGMILPEEPSVPVRIVELNMGTFKSTFRPVEILRKELEALRLSS
jgi:hypothetical protein